MADVVLEQQRAFAIEVVKRLRGAGFQSLWAGGCVRDLLMGRDPKDFDVATDARPEQVRELFGRRQTLEVGAAFGVIMVRGPKSAGQVEVATFRQDAAYSDGRHPDSVTFSDPMHDAQRRDFTINGMFYDPLTHEVHDYVAGRADLEARVLRAIGDPRRRFEEDKLRMLRAVRFAAKFEFALDAATLAAVQEMAPQLTQVSAERIQAEVRAMLTHANRAQAMRLLREAGLLAVILPEAMSLFGRRAEHVADAASVGADAGSIRHEVPWKFTLQVLDRLSAPSFPLALAALAHRVEQPIAVCEQVAERWKLANKEADLAVWLVAHQRELRGARRVPWSVLQPILIREELPELLRLEAAVHEVLGLDTSDLDYCRRCLALPPHELNPPPLLTGNDLIDHGVPRGPIYKQLLDQVRDAQLEKTIHDKRHALALVDRLLAK